MSLDNIQLVGAIGVNADGSVRVPDGTTSATRESAGTYVCRIGSEIGIDEALPMATPWVEKAPEPIALVVRMETPTTVRVICFATVTGLPTDFPFNLMVYRLPQL